MPPDTSRQLDSLAADLAAAVQLRNIARLRAGLEHELRSPLNAMVLNLELLRELLRAEGGAGAVAQLERVETIGSAVRRLQHGLDALLRETEPPGDTVEAFDLGELVRDVAAVVDAEMRQRGKRLEVGVDGEPTRVRGRRDALRQALLHLLIRALHATPGGGRVELSVERSGGGAVVAVRDEGPPLDDRARDRLFERPSAPDDDRLGLHVAHELIARDGGELRLVDSGPDGTLFHLVLPEARR